MPRVFPKQTLNKQQALQQAMRWADTGAPRVKKKDRAGIMQGYTTPGEAGGAAVGKKLKKAADTKAGFWNDVAKTRTWAKPGPNYKKK